MASEPACGVWSTTYSSKVEGKMRWRVCRGSPSFYRASALRSQILRGPPPHAKGSSLAPAPAPPDASGAPTQEPPHLNKGSRGSRRRKWNPYLSAIAVTPHAGGTLRTLYLFHRADETPLRMTLIDTDTLFGVPEDIVKEIEAAFATDPDRSSGVKLFSGG